MRRKTTSKLLMNQKIEKVSYTLLTIDENYSKDGISPCY